MLDRLFGPHRSLERQAAIALSGLVIVLGLAIIPSMGFGRGLSVALLGVLTGAVLARMAENRNAAKASKELLATVQTGEIDEDHLREMVDKARSSGPSPVVGENSIDPADLPFADDA